MLCMIWAIDEAISLSPLRALPSLSLSPCCLMFQFGGSKHSIRQINCLMHVISQTVYERGAPRPGAASLPPPPSTAAASFSLPCSPRAHCLLPYKQAHLTRRKGTQTHTRAPEEQHVCSFRHVWNADRSGAWNLTAINAHILKQLHVINLLYMKQWLHQCVCNETHARVFLDCTRHCM